MATGVNTSYWATRTATGKAAFLVFVLTSVLLVAGALFLLIGKWCPSGSTLNDINSSVSAYLKEHDSIVPLVYGIATCFGVGSTYCKKPLTQAS